MTVDIAAANREALSRLCAARPAWTGVRPAREAVGLEGRALLHAGPPIEWERMCGPMQGAVIGAILFEGWAGEPADAERLAASGRVTFAPCHSRGAVGPMAGIISPSMPLLVVEDPVHGTTACSIIADGPWGWQLRFGAHAPETIKGLVWLRDVAAPAFGVILEKEGPLELATIMAKALTMGDEMHMRNLGATCLLIRALAGPIARVVADPGQRDAIMAFVARNNDQLFLTWAMSAAKAAARAIEGIRGSTVVSTMARNGVEFGIRVAGLGDRWFTGPASIVEGLYFPGFGPGDANPDIGDSAIMEVYGLGGMAMAASPAVLSIVGGKSFAEATNTTRRMAEICVGANPLFAIAALDGEGAPTGIDIRKVVRTSVAPTINTAVAHRDPKAGRMIGAGMATPPLEPFSDALVALAEEYAG